MSSKIYKKLLLKLLYNFFQTYGRMLIKSMSAYKNCLIENDCGNKNEVKAINELKRLQIQLSNKLLIRNHLELKSVSPRLYKSFDMELVVPGSYVPGQPIVKIASFQNTLTVMSSKQHPRKLNIRGSDGNLYQFLLKGHEDLRQDERVMQLFDLVNKLLHNNPNTLKRNLTIQVLNYYWLCTMQVSSMLTNNYINQLSF